MSDYIVNTNGTKLTITETPNTRHCGHFDHKCEHVVNERVESWKMCNRFELVIDE